MVMKPKAISSTPESAATQQFFYSFRASVETCSACLWPFLSTCLLHSLPFSPSSSAFPRPTIATVEYSILPFNRHQCKRLVFHSLPYAARLRVQTQAPAARNLSTPSSSASILSASPSAIPLASSLLPLLPPSWLFPLSSTHQTLPSLPGARQQSHLSACILPAANPTAQTLEHPPQTWTATTPCPMDTNPKRTPIHSSSRWLSVSCTAKGNPSCLSAS